MHKRNSIIFIFIFSFVTITAVYAQKDILRASLKDYGLDSTKIYYQVDSIMSMAIEAEAFPGAQLLVAYQGKVIFHNCYGFHTYDKQTTVGPQDLYDLASVTKILGPLPALMKLVDEGKLDLDQPFSRYWIDWKNVKNKKDLTLREILAHQAGLVPYIIFLNEVMKDGKLRKRFIRTEKSKKYELQAYEDIFVSNKFIKKMYKQIRKSEVSANKKYKYSGLTFLIYPELIRQLTGKDYEDYLKDEFYQPLGCGTLGFNPNQKNYTNKIIPTEYDSIYRKTVVSGWVHDENASLLGGISGNAGLFGTADDLARIMLMYNNYGKFQGRDYISEKTVREFTAVQFPQNDNRRGLGFDKPLLNNSDLSLSEAYPSPLSSEKSFGHSGFTGTFVWADPEAELVFIFLSNRVHPNRSHRQLYDLNIRPALQHTFYEAINESK